MKTGVRVRYPVGKVREKEKCRSNLMHVRMVVQVASTIQDQFRGGRRIPPNWIVLKCINASDGRSGNMQASKAGIAGQVVKLAPARCFGISSHTLSIPGLAEKQRRGGALVLGGSIRLDS